jgi:hypothetical protein
MAQSSKGSVPATYDVLRTVAALVSPIALATALLFYFGWVRSEAQAQAFGADASVFEMSAQDLILRSVNVLFFPIIGLTLLGILALRLHPRIQRHGRRAGRILSFSWLLAVVGLLLAIVAGPVGREVLPLFVLLAVAGTAYGALLSHNASPERQPLNLPLVGLIATLLIGIIFWQTERIARLAGESLAADLQADLPASLPEAAVISSGRLHLIGPGVTEERIPGDESGDTYRYSGLYLLQRSGGKYFLLTDGWLEGEGRLIVLSDSELIRLEFGQ